MIWLNLVIPYYSLYKQNLAVAKIVSWVVLLNRLLRLKAVVVSST